MDTVSGSRVHDRLARAQNRLDPKIMRAEAIAELDDLFRSGTAPDPQPDGMHPGRLVTMSVTRPSDAAVRAIAGMYMPWLGKSFDTATQTGINVLAASARAPMKLLWPGYTPVRELADRIECFPFRTRIDEGAVDPGLRVLKIDYDYEENPDFIIRRILDELVQIDDGLYLGKILLRLKSGWKPIGFFSLEK
jgi:hypothetical protein